ncbi:MAG: slipin family protein [Candidatus Omnitrophica bacterium]|nr:slipin family protein [Candidatus Omnitrophota bacterium]
MEYIILAALLVLIVLFLKMHIQRATLLEYERGLKYVKGKFTNVLEPGQYWYAPFFVLIRKIDVRPHFITIPGQEVLTSDGVNVKISLAAKYEIQNPAIAVNKVQNYLEALYLELQLALREIAGSMEVDSIIEKRSKISEQLMEKIEAKVQDIGLTVHSVDVKDIMFSGKLKDSFAKIVDARKEGQAILEKARGETAALRNLANAAKLLDSNPNLLQLRLIQTLNETKGNTLIFGMPSDSTPVPLKKGAPQDASNSQ